MSTESVDLKTGKAAGGANGGAAVGPGPGVGARIARWVWRQLTSLRLTLWLLGILAVAMAVATLIPQNAPREAYLWKFGTLLGPLIAGTTLHNIYGSWWFVGVFALLAASLVACVIQRVARLLQQERAWPGPVTEQGITSGAHTRWRFPQGAREVAEGLTAALHSAGYSVTAVPVDGAGHRALAGRRGRVTPWAPIVVHAGLVVILLGAAWGRWPSHGFHRSIPMEPGKVVTVRVAGEGFGLRLLDAGTTYDAQGHPTQYWAKVEVLEEGQVVRSVTVRPNAPLRYHRISGVLDSIYQSGYAVEVTRGTSSGAVPVALGPDGQVDMEATTTHLKDPAWLVFIHRFRDQDEQGRHAPAAQVFIDRSGHISSNWQQVGWVGEEPVTFEGVTFRLAPGGMGAQLTLDRDIGVPVVFAGFVIISLGALLVLGAPRSRVTALVTEGGKGSSALVRVSPAGDQLEAERLWSQFESRLGGERQPDRGGKLGAVQARRGKSSSSA